MPSSITFSNNVLHYTCDSIAGGLTDTSGNSNTGILQGTGTTSVAGQIGQAVSFNGSGYASFTSVSQLRLPTSTSEMSICCWIKTTATDAAIVSLRDASTTPLIEFSIGSNGYSNLGSGTPSVLLRDDASGGFKDFIAPAPPINNGNWRHVAFTLASSRLLTLYVDGASVFSDTSTLTTSLTPDIANSAFGREMFSATASFIGLMDDLQIYNRALTGTEVGSIYSAGASTVPTLWQGTVSLVGAGAITARLAHPKPITASLAGNSTLAVNLTQISRFITAALVGGGVFTASPALRARVTAQLAAAAALSARLAHNKLLQASFAAIGSLAAQPGLPGQSKTYDISNVFAGGFIDPDTRTPYGTWNARGHMRWFFRQQLAISAALNGAGALLPVDPIWMQSDFVWPGIVENAGSELLYRQAAGLEKAMADVGAYRLTQTYAELIVDQWDPWRISSTNLPYLAWAQGVNLWEDSWSEQFKRAWVAKQWQMKFERGSAIGLKDFVNTVNASPGMHARVTNLVVPPASFFPGPRLTEEERKAYVARFPQLRLYPYAPRPQLPWLNYLGGYQLSKNGQKTFVNNGHFFGPLRKFYPTNFNAGGLYLRKCTLYDPQTGVETQLTVRTIVAVPQPGQKAITYDEIVLDPNPGNLFYPGRGNQQYFFPGGTPVPRNRRHSIVLGRLPRTESRVVRIPRDHTLARTQYQALFTTIVPGLQPINVRPELVPVRHPRQVFAFYANTPLRYAYLTKSNAWQYFYERWYLFDPTRLPDSRKTFTIMGRARFGIHKYTAEADILASFNWPKYRATYGGFIGRGRFFAPKDTRLIDQIRRATTASMALRDTVQIDTNIKRRIQIKDLTVLDGRFSIGQYVTDTTA